MKITDTQVAPLFKNLAQQIEGIDLEIYQQYQRNPYEPIIGLGQAHARVGFFGRDPGRHEVEHHEPFIGAGGQKVRSTLYQYLYNKKMPSFEASKAVGRLFFWANTVPYKPIKNKAWSMKIKRQFLPLMQQIMAERWHGEHLITFGREAFLWFGINKSRAERQALEAFWKSEHRFDSFYPVTLGQGSQARSVKLYPLPHPSPLNATWYKHFPNLLMQRLKQLDVRLDNLNLELKP